MPIPVAAGLAALSAGGGGGISALGLGSLLSAGAGIGGTVASAFGASSANKGAKRAAWVQRKFQRKMRDSQYQAAMRDMKKAGLNPMLAFSNGGNASPMGSAAPVQNVFAGAGGDMAGAVNSATKRMEVTDKSGAVRAQLNLVNAQTAATKAQAMHTTQEAATSAAKQANIQQDTLKLESEIPYREDKAYGDLPWSGKAKRFYDQQHHHIQKWWKEFNSKPYNDKHYWDSRR